MIDIRKSEERGHFDHGWLNTYHTFSFDRYFDPRHLGFRSLRVINEDRIQPGTEFPEHPHRDMEIVTYIIAGELAHQDSMGNGSTIKPGEVQRMTAGSGVTHSESNSSATETTHLLQIWIFPEKKGLTPGYEQRAFSEDDKLNRWRLIVGPKGKSDALEFHQDAYIYASVLAEGERLSREFAEGRYGWLQVISGEIDLNGQRLKSGDGAAINGESEIEVSAEERAEFLLFDLA